MNLVKSEKFCEGANFSLFTFQYFFVIGIEMIIFVKNKRYDCIT